MWLQECLTPVQLPPQPQLQTMCVWLQVQRSKFGTVFMLQLVWCVYVCVCARMCVCMCVHGAIQEQSSALPVHTVCPVWLINVKIGAATTCSFTDSDSLSWTHTLWLVASLLAAHIYSFLSPCDAMTRTYSSRDLACRLVCAPGC